MTKTKGAKLPFEIFEEAIWIDAASHDGWVEVNEDADPIRIITRGWLIKETETYIVLAASLQLDIATTVGSTQIIPKGMLVSRVRIRTVKSKTKPNIKRNSEDLEAVTSRTGEGVSEK